MQYFKLQIIFKFHQVLHAFLMYSSMKFYHLDFYNYHNNQDTELFHHHKETLFVLTFLYSGGNGTAFLLIVKAVFPFVRAWPGNSISLLPTFHCLECNRGATPNCTRGWEVDFSCEPRRKYELSLVIT